MRKDNSRALRVTPHSACFAARPSASGDMLSFSLRYVDVFRLFWGGVQKHTSQGVANALFVLLPNLSFFNCIISHFILYHIFNRPYGANRDVLVR